MLLHWATYLCVWVQLLTLKLVCMHWTILPATFWFLSPIFSLFKQAYVLVGGNIENELNSSKIFCHIISNTKYKNVFIIISKFSYNLHEYATDCFFAKHYIMPWELHNFLWDFWLQLSSRKYHTI